MDIRHLRDLALKILGIYYLSIALAEVPQIAGLFITRDYGPEMAGHEFAIALSVLLPLVFWFGIGLLLTFRTSIVTTVLWRSQPELAVGPMAKPFLRFWIVLIGFFFAVDAAGGAVAEVWILALQSDMRGDLAYSPLFPELIKLVLSGFCILRAHVIEAWLKTKMEDRHRNPEVDSSTRVEADLGTPRE